MSGRWMHAWFKESFRVGRMTEPVSERMGGAGMKNVGLKEWGGEMKAMGA